MKKVFLVLALVATYGVSMAMSGSNVISVNNDQVTIVADVNNSDVVAPENEKEKEKATTKEAKTTKSEAKSEGCATAKSEGCGEKAKAECADKKEGSKK